MKRDYLIGSDKNKIYSSVKIGTVGVAYSSSDLKRSGGQTESIGESGANSGSVSKKLIGLSKDIRGSTLVSITVIDFSAFSASDRKIHVENIVAKYTVNGGVSGEQVFNFDSDDIVVSKNKRFVVISKAIKLK